MREEITRREIEASPKFPNEKIIFDLNEWNFVKIDQVQHDASAQENLTEIYRDLLTNRIAALEPNIRPTAFGAIRCKDDGVHAKDGVRLVQFASGAFCLQEDRYIEGHSDLQPTGTVVAKCVFWDRVIGQGWDQCFQSPRNFCEENKKLFRLDDVLASGLLLEKATPQGHDGKDPPPEFLLYDFNKTTEWRLRCRFLGKETWDKLIAEKHVRSSMEEVAVEFFQTYKQEQQEQPRTQVDAAERQRQMNEENERKKQELMKTFLFKPPEPVPVEAIAPVPAADTETTTVAAPRKRRATACAITFGEKPKQKRKKSKSGKRK